MDRAAPLAKTAKGMEEMKSRAHGLPQKYRSLLILADGTASAGLLIEKLGAAAEEGLQLLLDQGFIQVAGAAPAAAQPAPPAPKPQQPGGESLRDIDLGGG